MDTDLDTETLRSALLDEVWAGAASGLGGHAPGGGAYPPGRARRVGANCPAIRKGVSVEWEKRSYAVYVPMWLPRVKMTGVI